jgi:hypothetical protein
VLMSGFRNPRRTERPRHCAETRLLTRIMHDG